MQAHDINAVLSPIATARGLPNAMYIDETMADAERQHVFYKNWTALTTGKNIPHAGCVMPVNMLGIPMLVTRNKDGEIKVFENVCRHRGMILVDEPKRLNGPITCPYHAWAYDMDGHLRATPHVGGADIHEHEAIDKECLSLNQIRSHVWMDVIFVNIDGKAPAFEDMHSDIITRWAEFDKPIYHSGADSSFSLTLNSNWKLAIENYCESYHLPFVHPGLNSYSRLEDHYHIEGPGHYSGQGSYVYNPSLDETGRTFPNFAGISNKWDQAAEYLALYPNVLLGVHRDHVYNIIITPDAVNKTTEQIEIYYADPSALDDSYDDMRQKNSTMWKDIFIEDIGVVQGMFNGRSAPQYDGGQFSPVMDGPTHYFHQWVARQMAA